MNKTCFLQGDSRWGGLVYPKKPCYIRNVGCGEVSIANILIEMEQYAQYTPATIQPYCKQFGAPNCDGTYLSGICKMMKHYGLTDVKECDTMPQLWKELEKGDRVAIYLMGKRPGGSKKIHWTSGGHFISSVGYEYKNGKHYVYVKDPWTNASNRNGWLTYEEHMKGDVLGVYVGKLSGAKTTVATKNGKLVVDGIGGAATIRASQKYFKTVEDGIISDQLKKLKVYYPSVTAVEFGKGKTGSGLVKAIQKWLGLTRDGLWGQGTSAAMQKKLRDLGYLAKNEKIDGIFGVKSMKAWQKFLNDELFKEEEKPTEPTPTTPTDSGSTTPIITPTVAVTTPTAEKKSVYTAIDVSDWQRQIDWKKVKGDGIDAAIIRYADGDTLDARFDENMKGAIAAGLHVGAYIFSRAKTKAQAEKEADRLFNACKPYKLDLPMYIDLEAKNYGKYADTVARAFISRIKALGWKPGVYSSLYWWNNYLKDVAKLSFAMWVAQYNSTMDYKPKSYVGMWQYTSSGNVNGISTRVDMDKLYVPYWEELGKKGETPTVEPPKEEEKPVVPQKSIDELAQEVLDGKWGSGDKRKANLEAAGYDYNKVQARVNEILDQRQKIEELANEVLEGKWGSGDERKKRLTEAGYDYDAVQKRVNEIVEARKTNKEKVVEKGNEWAKKIAADDRYGYMKWNSSDKQTRLCPICSGVDYSKDPNHFGWNCIGAAFAVWHHGMGLPCKCNTHVIANEIGEKILKATDAEALKIAQDHVGMKNIEVIRNKGNNIPQSKWQAGDIMLTFNGNTYTHTWYYLGNNQLFESTGSNGKVAKKNQVRIASSKSRTAKVIIRWIDTTVVEEKKGYGGEMPSRTLKKTNAEAIADAIRWAVWIAGDNAFHYGYTNKHGSKDSKDWNPNAHHNGCYFCGTNTDKGGRSKAGILDYKKTYCCNPFVGAAWAHGGCIPKALELCQNGSSWDFHKGAGYDKSSLFTNLGKPAKSKLQKGDVLCSDSHVALYIGDGKIAEAASGDDNKRNSAKWNNSIHVTTLTDSRYKSFKRVHRYNGSVNTTCNIYFGEISKRVENLQHYLIWYGYAITADGIFGEQTNSAVRDIQGKLGLTVDGIVGVKTIEAMAKVVK